MANVHLAVELVEDAVEDGMPPYHEVRALIPVARAAVGSGLRVADLPDAVTPNSVTRRALASFRLSKAQALTVAACCRADPGGERDDDSDALGEINWLLPDVEFFLEQLTDPLLAAEVRGWLEVADDLSPV